MIKSEPMTATEVVEGMAKWRERSQAKLTQLESEHRAIVTEPIIRRIKAILNKKATP